MTNSHWHSPVHLPTAGAASIGNLCRYLTLVLLVFAFAGCASWDSSKTEASQESAREPQTLGLDAPGVRLITAQTPAVRAYRKSAAGAIYKKYPKRLYRGRIPPLVYAVVVVETDIDADGTVKNVSFSRVPGHAPEVPPKIAELIRAASPLPNPGKLGAHTYVDTWLWDKSGQFQLDTLTQGQRSR